MDKPQKSPPDKHLHNDPDQDRDQDPGQDRENDPCITCISRRGVLRTGAAAVGASALWAALPAGCMQSNAAPSGPVAAGNVADIPIGTLNPVSGENVILGRDPGGVYAMSRVCTHQGQIVAIVTIGGVPALHCPAHGSEFNMNGAVTHGPASQALEHFEVDLGADGSITIRAGEVVAALTRTPAT